MRSYADQAHGLYTSKRRAGSRPAKQAWAEEEGLSPDAIEKMYRDMIYYSIDCELKDRMRAG